MEGLANINKKILDIDKEITRLEKHQDYCFYSYKRNEAIDNAIINLRKLKDKLLFKNNLKKELSKIS